LKINQKFGVSKGFLMFLKEVSYAHEDKKSSAHQKKTKKKTCDIVKYYCNLK